ncbi:hypothetical protein WMF04_24115 [Sorangium sp. So ce260]|uniref:formylglycine-generating enzyme family protein n=1 Tax=Sorangium sp. So ce260 TaxID=3133291 RepID=UPI003F606F0C
MPSNLAALRTFHEYDQLAPAARLALVRPLADALNHDFEPHSRLVGARALCAVRHRSTKLVFAAVPGGLFDMGLTDADIEHASEYVDWTAPVQQFIGRLERVSRPVHRVAVRPFVCATTPVDKKHLDTICEGGFTSDTFDAQEARNFVAELGFRLPSEAELEYLARDGGTEHFVNAGTRAVSERGRWVDWPEKNALGFRHLNMGEWAADDWHESYEGAPSTSDPWFKGDPRGVYRGALPLRPESRDEILFGLSAFRGEGADDGDDDIDRRYFLVRLALDLPV